MSVPPLHGIVIPCVNGASDDFLDQLDGASDDTDLSDTCKKGSDQPAGNKNSDTSPFKSPNPPGTSSSDSDPKTVTNIGTGPPLIPALTSPPKPKKPSFFIESLVGPGTSSSSSSDQTETANSAPPISISSEQETKSIKEAATQNSTSAEVSPKFSDLTLTI